jgi:hypothetical protein
MSLQEYGEKWVNVHGIRSPLFRGWHGAPIVLFHGGTRGDASGDANKDDFDGNFVDFAREFRAISADWLAFRQHMPDSHGRSSAIDGGR